MFSLRVALLAASAMTIGLAASPAFAEEAERDRSICAQLLEADVTCAPRRDGSDIDREPARRNVEPASPLIDSDNGFRISVDGQPMAGAAASAADLERRRDIDLVLDGMVVQVDNLDPKPVLNILADLETAAEGEVVTFATWSNYHAFIARSEVRIFEAGDSLTREPLAIVPVLVGEEASWTVPPLPKRSRAGAYDFVLRVYDGQGRFDETSSQSVAVAQDAAPASAQDAPHDILAINRLATRAIPVDGSTVTVRVPSTPAGAELMLGFQKGFTDKDGTSFAQAIVPDGVESLQATLLTATDWTHRPVRIAQDPHDNDAFTFLFADVTLGQRSVSSGASELLGPETSADDEGIADGRLAFYLKRRFGDGWRLTASADTRERPLEDLFDGMLEKDSRSLLRRLDPDRSWPVFGDDSTLIEDAPTSGRFYLRAEQGEDHLVWGDFQTSLTGNELANFSRTLYGASLRQRSQERTENGDHRGELDVFLADPGSIGARDEFRGTGGSVFFLRQQDILEGSERVFVEVRDRDSGLVESRHELIGGRDYDVSYLQGRLFLRSPLATNADNALFVRDGSFSGDTQHLVVTYEYQPGVATPDAFTGGGRAAGWITDNVRIGLTGYEQSGDVVDQTIVAGDLTLQIAPSTYIKAELARSDGAGIVSQDSFTGGFQFNELAPATSSGLVGEADAQRLEAAVDLRDLDPQADGRVTAYWQDREAGFSAPGQVAGIDGIEQTGMSADVALGQQNRLKIKGDTRDGDQAENSRLEAGIERALDEQWKVGAGLRWDEQRREVPTASELLNENGERLDAAVTLGYSSKASKEGEIRSPWEAYVFGQATLETSGDRADNDRVGAGGSWQVSRRLRALGELSTGDLDFGAKAGAEWAYTERSTAYLNYALGAENADAFETNRLGRSGRFSAGAKHRFSDSVGVFAEGRYVHGSGPTGLTQTYGVNLSPEGEWAFGLSTEFGRLSDPVNGDIDRRAVSGTAAYTRDDTKVSATLERRDDDGAASIDRVLWAWRLTGSQQVNPGLRLFGKLNGAETEASVDPALEAEFLEGVAAFAWRPVENDRLNLLAKYTWLEDLPSPAQVGANGTGLDFAQRSNVVALDATYELTGSVTVGGRVATRLSELRASRDPAAPWFDNRANFFSARVDWNLIKEWDALAEWRTIEIEQIGSSQSGAVVGLSRHLSDNVRLGVGYNFTDYSEELTDLSGDQKGWFLNLSAAF